MVDSPVAIVTGGAQGIGASICKELLKTGYKICFADIQETKANLFLQEQQLIYGKENIIFISCDVAKETDYTRLFDLTLKTYERIDVLINNAGVCCENDPRKCLEINLLGPLFGCRTALKYMGKSSGGNGGVVINIASVVGFLPSYKIPVYAASKHGVIGLTRSFGLPFYYDKDGITFTSLCPYKVSTDLLKGARSIFGPDLKKTHPDGLLSLENVAKGVLKLLEDKINGSTLLVLLDGFHYLEIDENLLELMPTFKEQYQSIRA